MKKILSYVLLAAVVMSAGCSKENTVASGDGKGRVCFTVDFGKATRAEVPAPENCVIKIANSEGIIYQYDKIADIPSELWLVAGDYTVTVEGGERVVSGFNKPFYKGAEPFEITTGKKTDVAVKCVLMNALFTVTFGEGIAGEMEDYTVTLQPDMENDEHDLVFDAANTGEDGAVGYVIPSASLTEINWVFTGTHEKYGQITKTGSFGIDARKHYDLKFTYTVSSGDFDMGFKVTVDERVIDEYNYVPIYQAPRAVPSGFSFGEVVGQADSYKMAFTASSDIRSIVLSGSVLGEGVDVLTESMAGVELETKSAAEIAMTLTSALFNTMTMGQNDITIAVTDENGKTREVIFSILITDISGVSGSLDAIVRTNIWAAHATLTGTISGGDESTVVRVGYRQSGEQWQYADAVKISEGKYSAKLTGLSASTTYEARLEANSAFKGNPLSFTTEDAPALENGGFENWWQDGNTWRPYSQTGSRFWDTANEGLSSANNSDHKNLTNYVDEARPDSPGTRSARMKSQYVTVVIVNKFAAGNIYVGKFGKVEALKGGATVHFGQPFTSRPTRFKGWYKGNAGTVNHAGDGSPIGNGAPDQFHIFACLTTWTKQHQLDTWDSSTFMNFNKDEIIAVGEVTGTGDFSDKWYEFDIPIEYKRTDVIPTYLLVVASSSKYGDYFTGSTDSWLQVDDFELVYDDNVVVKD